MNKKSITYSVMCLWLLAGASSVLAAPNGRNATVVQFANGSFEQIAPGQWQEYGSGSNQPRFTFQETNRDDWSVYMLDHSRAIRLQLDLHRRWIRYADQSMHDYVDLYQIVSADERMNGRMVGQVGYAQGAFRHAGGGRWVETDAHGVARYNFRETGRDMWSAYMTDDSRNVRIQIDMHRGMIRYADQRSPNYWDLYQITGYGH